MSSSSAVLSAKPRVRRAPRAASNEVDDAVFLSSSYGLTPDDWQEDALESWLGRKRDGRWAAATCGLAVPRQNGKNGAIEVRELFGMVELGEKFLHTAHEVKTARKAFRRIASFFENEREYPELAALVKEIRKTNGQEAIVLTNGGSVEFIARSRGSGRGFTVDVLVCDEAQELTSEELEALLPTISAAPSGNPQVILTGTPPKPGRPQGEAFRAVRKAGEANTDARLAWTDFGVADGPLPDVTDRQLWFQVNPALGSRLQVAEVERELGLMTPEGFAVERLGWWGDPTVIADGIFPSEIWTGQRIDAPDGDPQAFGLDMTWDREWADIGWCRGGYVDLHKHARGTGWVVAECVALQKRYPNAAVWTDPKGPAATLIEPLRDAGVRVEEVTYDDYKRACGAFYDAVTQRELTHSGHPALDAAVAGAVVTGGSNGWVWDRKKGAVISPLVAVTHARHGAQQGSGFNIW
jgi:phage terminase large subunit-like protein